MEQRLNAAAEEELARITEENRLNVARFVATPEGKRAHLERAEAYRDANPGIDMQRAHQEAYQDIVASNEQQLKRSVLTDAKEKRHLQRQRLQIRRLQVVHELIKLEAQYQEAIGGKPRPWVRDLISDFDPGFVAKIKQEPWYVVARHSAAQARDRDAPAVSPVVKPEGALGQSPPAVERQASWAASSFPAGSPHLSSHSFIRRVPQSPSLQSPPAVDRSSLGATPAHLAYPSSAVKTLSPAPNRSPQSECPRLD